MSNPIVIDDEEDIDFSHSSAAGPSQVSCGWVKELLSMGFPRDKIDIAVKRFGTLNAAINWLLSGAKSFSSVDVNGPIAGVGDNGSDAVEIDSAGEDDVVVTKEVSGGLSVDDLLNSSPVVTVADVTQSSSTALTDERHHSIALSTKVEAEDVCTIVQCLICDEHVTLNKTYSLDSCSHRFCLACLVNHVRQHTDSNLPEKSSEKLGASPVARVLLKVDCPFPFCEGLLAWRDLKDLLTGNEFNAFCKWSLAVFQRSTCSSSEECTEITCPVCGGGMCYSKQDDVLLLPDGTAPAKLLVQDLKAHLGKRNLSKVGNRADLLARLKASIIKEKSGSVPSDDPRLLICKDTKCAAAVCSACGGICTNLDGSGDSRHSACPQRLLFYVLQACRNLQTLMSASEESAIGKHRRKRKTTRDGGVGYSGSARELAGGHSQQAAAAQRRQSDHDNAVAELFDFLAVTLKAMYTFDEASGLPATSLHPLLSALLARDVLPVLTLYLHNDSMMDLGQRSELYFALLKLLGAFAGHVLLLSLLEQPIIDEDGDESDSAMILLRNLHRQSKIFVQVGQQGDLDDGFTLSLGMALEISNVFDQIKESLDNLKGSEVSTTCQSRKRIFDSESELPAAKRRRAAATAKLVTSCDGGSEINEQAYVESLGALRFDSGAVLQQSHRFYADVQQSAMSGVGSNQRVLRISQELSSMSTSLPVNYSSSVFVRVDDDHMDCLKALIIGPEGTPYANGVFEFDIFLPPEYPNEPPKCLLVTTGQGRVRFNPNLYACGKVCLSLLGTWAGPSWDVKNSTLLQVLVSIQGMILVSDPFFNEPGWEAQRGTPYGRTNSKIYNARIRHATVAYAMVGQLQRPPPVFTDVVREHFRLKADVIRQQCREWVSQAHVANSSSQNPLMHIGGGLSSDHASMLHAVNLLETELSRLKPIEL